MIFRALHLFFFLLAAFVNPVLSQSFTDRPVLKVQQGHLKEVTGLAYSQNGKLLASSGGDHLVKVWHVLTGRELRTLEGHTGTVKALCFFDGNKTVLSASADKTLILWDIATGRKKRQMHGHRAAIESVCYNRATGVVASGDSEGEIILWEGGTGREILRFSVPVGGARDLLFLQNGRVLACAASSGSIFIFDTQSGQLLRQMNGHTAAVNSLASVANEPGLLASAADDQTVRLWNTGSGRQVRTLFGHDAAVKAVTFSEDGRQLFSGAENGEIIVWDADRFTKTRSLRGHTGGIRGLSSDKRGYLASGSLDHTVRVWDVSTGFEQKKLVGYTSSLRALAVNPAKPVFATAGESHKVLLREMASGLAIHLMAAHLAPINDLAFSHSGEWLASASDDQQMVLWDVAKGQEQLTFKGHSAPVQSVCFSSEDIKIASGSLDQTVKIWNPLTARLILTCYGHSAGVNSVAFMPGSTTVASGSDDGTFRLWNSETGAPLLAQEAHAGGVKAVAFSPDAALLATAGADETIKIWTTDGWEMLHILEGTSASITSLDFSPDGTLLAAGSENGIVRVWQPLRGRLRATFARHESPATDVAFDNTGELVLSTGHDHQLKIWSLAEGLEVLNMVGFDNGHDFMVNNLEGQFNGTQAGIEQAVHFVQGMDVIPLDALRDRFQVPGLWQEVMTGRPLPVAPAVADARMTPLPEVYITAPPFRGEPEGFRRLPEGLMSDSSEIMVTAELYDTGGGISEVKIFQNGKLIKRLDSAFSMPPREGNLVKYSFPVKLQRGRNNIRVSACNEDHYESSMAFTEVAWETFTTPTANLYILATGINNYKNEKYNLNYAEADARAFVKAVKKGGRNIFRNIFTTELYNETADKKAILQAFENIISQASEEDVFVFYFAGHGVLEKDSQDRDQYYLCPVDVTQLYGNSVLLEDKALSAEKLKELSRNVKAQKQLVLLDACQSGGAARAFSYRGSGEEKAIIQLARSTGMTVIAASDSEQYASEVEELGHGIFTYCLLQALDGIADGTVGDKKVTVGEIRVWLEEQIPELSKKHKGTVQYPLVYSSGQDFPLVVIE